MPPDKFAASTHGCYISLKDLQNQSTVKIKSIFILKNNSVTLNIGHKRRRKKKYLKQVSSYIWSKVKLNKQPCVRLIYYLQFFMMMM